LREQLIPPRKVRQTMQFFYNVLIFEKMVEGGENKLKNLTNKFFKVETLFLRKKIIQIQQFLAELCLFESI